MTPVVLVVDDDEDNIRIVSTILLARHAERPGPPQQLIDHGVESIIEPRTDCSASSLLGISRPGGIRVTF